MLVVSKSKRPRNSLHIHHTSTITTMTSTPMTPARLTASKETRHAISPSAQYARLSIPVSTWSRTRPDRRRTALVRSNGERERTQGRIAAVRWVPVHGRGVVVCGKVVLLVLAEGAGRRGETTDASSCGLRRQLQETGGGDTAAFTHVELQCWNSRTSWFLGKVFSRIVPLRIVSVWNLLRRLVHRRSNRVAIPRVRSLARHFLPRTRCVGKRFAVGRAVCRAVGGFKAFPFAEPDVGF